jgi:hypothetical protein
MFTACLGVSEVATRPISGGALRPSTRLAALLRAISSYPRPIFVGEQGLAADNDNEPIDELAV